MYDLKTYYNQAKNIVLQVPEMEAKVLEATNEDAWSVHTHPRTNGAGSIIGLGF